MLGEMDEVSMYLKPLYRCIKFLINNVILNTIDYHNICLQMMNDFSLQCNMMIYLLLSNILSDISQLNGIRWDSSTDSEILWVLEGK